MNKKIKGIGVLLVVLLLGSCGGLNQPTVTKEDRAIFEKLMQQRTFTITSYRASPMATTSFNAIINSGLLPPGNTANAISLVGTSNYLTIKGDSIFGYLPYFGERRMGGNYGATDTGISFEGIPEKMTIATDSVKQRAQFYIEIADKNNITEQYQIRITAYPNLKSVMNVTSTHRTPISFVGTMAPLSASDSE